MMHAILWCSESCDCNKDEYDKTKCLVDMKEPLLWEYSIKSPAELRSGLGHSQSIPQSCAAVSASLEVFCRSTQRSMELQNLTIPDGAPGNAYAESERTLLSSRWVWERLEVLRNTAEVALSVWEDCMWLPDRITFCWCAPECSYCNGGAIRMLQNLTLRIITYCSWRDLCAGLWKTSRAAESSAHPLQESWCRILTAVVLRVP